ncbi:MAG TPA: hypothetical protein VGG25_08865 [Streptosporangiaceae bacterium]
MAAGLAGRTGLGGPGLTGWRPARRGASQAESRGALARAVPLGM